MVCALAGSETPSSAHPPIGTCQTVLTSKKAQATSTGKVPPELCYLTLCAYEQVCVCVCVCVCVRVRVCVNPSLLYVVCSGCGVQTSRVV